MRDKDYIKMPEILLMPEIVQMLVSIHEHKGKQELFIEANVDHKIGKITKKEIMEPCPDISKVTVEGHRQIW